MSGIIGDNVARSSGLVKAAGGGATTPYWSAELSSEQATTDGAYTKLNFNTEITDSDGAYDNSSNYRFTVPSGADGKYCLWTAVVSGTSLTGGVGLGNEWQSRLSFYKNNSLIMSDWSAIKVHAGGTKVARTNHCIVTIEDLSAADYIEVFLWVDVEDTSYTYGTYGSNTARFGGFKLID